MKLLKGIYHVYTGLVTVGVLSLISDGTLDVYSFSAWLAFCLGSYLIYQDK